MFNFDFLKELDPESQDEAVSILEDTERSSAANRYGKLIAKRPHISAVMDAANQEDDDSFVAAIMRGVADGKSVDRVISDMDKQKADVAGAEIGELVNNAAQNQVQQGPPQIDFSYDPLGKQSPARFDTGTKEISVNFDNAAAPRQPAPPPPEVTQGFDTGTPQDFAPLKGRPSLNETMNTPALGMLAGQVQNMDELASILMNASVEELQGIHEAIQSVLEQRPVSPRIAELAPPNLWQAAIGTLFGLTQNNPAQALALVTMPMQFKLQQQATQQKGFDAQFQNEIKANDAQVKALQTQAETVLERDKNNAANLIALAKEANGMVSDAVTAETSRMNTQANIAGRFDVAQINNISRMALEQFKQQQAFERIKFQSPEAEKMRMWQVLTKVLVEAGVPPKEAASIALAPEFRAYYQNQNTQANTAYTTIRATLYPKELELKLLEYNARLSDMQFRQNMAVQEFDQKERQMAAEERKLLAAQQAELVTQLNVSRDNLQESYKTVADERAKYIEAQIKATPAGKKYDPAADPKVQAYDKQLTSIQGQINVVDNDIKEVTSTNISSVNQFDGRYKETDIINSGTTKGKYLLGGNYPLNLDRDYVYGSVAENENDAVDCAAFVGYAIRNAVLTPDPNFPKMGTATQLDYIKKNLGKGWEEVRDPLRLMPGDLIYTESRASGSGRHVVMFSGYENGRPVYVGAQSSGSGTRTSTSLSGPLIGIYRQTR